MRTIRNFIVPGAEGRCCSGSNNPQLAPRTTPPKREGDNVSLPFSSPLQQSSAVIAQKEMIGTVNQVARAGTALSVSADPGRLGRKRERGVVPKRRRSILLFVRYLFFVIGILALGYVGIVLLDARQYQAAQSRQFQQELNGLKPPIGSDELLHPSSLPSGRAGVTRARADSIGIAGGGDSRRVSLQ